MARIEKTVFISYRRVDVYTALAVYENLKNQGYDVFFDYRSISSGDFEQIITSNIRARAHFLLILTPNALDRCNEPGDWLRREIELAIDEKRNIVPLFFKGFRFGGSSNSGISKWLPFGKPDVLTGKLGDLPRYNGLNVHEDYFEEAMVRVRIEFLNKPLDTVLHPVSTEVQKVVEEEQSAADEAIKQKEDKKEPVKPVEEKPDRQAELEILKSQALRLELKGDFWDALQIYYKIKKINPTFPRVDVKIQELEEELKPKPIGSPVTALQTKSAPRMAYPWQSIAKVAGIVSLLLFCIWGGSSFYGNLANNNPQLTKASQYTATPTPKSGATGTLTAGKVIINAVKDDTREPFTAGDGVEARIINYPIADNLDDDGILSLESCRDGQFIVVSAVGYDNKTLRCESNKFTYEVSLSKFADNDLPIAMAGYTSYDEPHVLDWLRSGHATTLTAPYFRTMYMGTDIYGNSSPYTSWDMVDGHMVRRTPVMNENYRGPGFKLDYPDPNEHGNCAFCHAPGMVNEGKISIDLMGVLLNLANGELIDSTTNGVTCDVCHTIVNKNFDGPFPDLDKPGVLSFERMNSIVGYDNIFIGPKTNVYEDFPEIGVICSELFTQSEFCAPCHYGEFGNTVIYNSFGEWKESKYSDDSGESDYKTCQDCHMPHNEFDNKNSSTEKYKICSVENYEYKDSNHNVMDLRFDLSSQREIPGLIVGAATLNVVADVNDGKVVVVVTVTNTKAGHKFPTDSPLRSLILVVVAKDAHGKPLVQVAGNNIPQLKIPDSVIGGDPDVGYFSGAPGTVFSMTLQDKETGVFPTTSYWNPVNVLSDTRLAPESPDSSIYIFEIPNGEKGIDILSKLIYRYAPIELMEQKGWSRPDIIVAQTEIRIP